MGKHPCRGKTDTRAAILAEVRIFMTENELLLAAANGQFPTENIDIIDQLLWYKAKDLYRAFAAGTITKELGLHRKIKILRDYRAEKAKQRTQVSLYKATADLYKNISSATALYAKSRTLQNADIMYQALYKMLPASIDFTCN